MSSETPDVDLIKTVDRSSSTAPGTFIYTVTIRNTGNTNFSIVEFTDSDFSHLPDQLQELIGMQIPVNQSISRNYTITYDKAGSYSNTAFIKISDINGKIDTDTDTQNITVNELNVEGAMMVFGAEMPHTGDSSSGLFVLTGIIILTSSGILLLLLYRKEKSL
jgi:LPXTG-motif cell wall-anchored protein